MAWLERKGTLYRIRFRHGGRKMLCALKTDDEDEAHSSLVRFKENLKLVERGRLAIPESADIGLFLLSDGKLNKRPLEETAKKRLTLAQAFALYRASPRAKERTTLYTEDIHLAHLERLLGASTRLDELTAKQLQEYVDTRSGETRCGRKIVSCTVKKEIGTLACVWNQWAVPQGLASGPAPTGLLTYGKETSKPPFQTREQIEAQIALHRLSAARQRELWECLFLTLPDVDDVLAVVRDHPGPRYAFPMFVFAAHTGARRSEILRSERTDFDFESQVVIIREKKKDCSKHMTFRSVPMTPTLAAVIREWFQRHPGGPFTVCTATGKPISVQLAAKTFVRLVSKSRWSVLPGWHCFRHSFISNCVSRGVDQRLIDHWVGHTTEAMRQRYSHLIPRTSQEALLSVFGGGALPDTNPQSPYRRPASSGRARLTNRPATGTRSHGRRPIPTHDGGHHATAQSDC